jgi:hypothetical protein
LWRACLQDYQKTPRHLFRDFKDRDLQDLAFIVVRDAEEMFALALAKKTRTDGRKNAEMTGHVLRVFVGINLGKGNCEAVRAGRKNERRWRGSIQSAQRGFFERSDGAADVQNLTILDR